MITLEQIQKQESQMKMYWYLNLGLDDTFDIIYGLVYKEEINLIKEMKKCSFG